MRHIDIENYELWPEGWRKVQRVLPTVHNAYVRSSQNLQEFADGVGSIVVIIDHQASDRTAIH